MDALTRERFNPTGDGWSTFARERSRPAAPPRPNAEGHSYQPRHAAREADPRPAATRKAKP